MIERVLAALRVMFGSERVGTPIESMVTHWDRDEFSRGSYSFCKCATSEGGPGEDIEDKECAGYAPFIRLAEAEHGGRLRFAGEATSAARFGYVDGAMQTGVREARQIIVQEQAKWNKRRLKRTGGDAGGGGEINLHPRL